MIDKTYAPAEVEARISAAWEAAQCFKAGRPDLTEAERAKAQPYCIVIPPPNVTGSLHMGHALDNTLQDVLIRYHRMRGRDTLWQVGTDHAGIATQMIVERQMAERQEPNRQAIGRDAFIEKVWAWKAESGGTIINQLKRLGASCDWSRERFTMDEGLSKAVLDVFVALYDKGLIYRDKRLVNWDPSFQSAISDLEVDQIEHKGSFKWSDGEVDKEGNPVPLDMAKLSKVLAKDPAGHMYHFRYPLKNDPKQFVVVATTRPETMLGDTAVAVHPEHPTLAALIGTKLVLPLVGREIPVVGDTYADPEKGTGAVKITPAHDFNDFELGKRHNLPQINILDAGGRLNEAVPAAYRGMDRFAARLKVVEDLAALGLIAKIEPTAHTVPHAQRGGTIVEPWLTDQWYVDAVRLAQPAIAAVEDGRTRFVPKQWEKTYFEWMRNIQPWCISRQIWWGHQIPAWYGPDGSCFVARDEAAAYAKAAKHYADQSPNRSRLQQRGQRGHGFVLTRDPDVLDTWFSSALWPFSTLGWPEETDEVKRYYPNAVLVTGFDIIFFWVARMMMMGMEFKGEVPFKDIYIHGLVRDEKGHKMSKTKGNVIDPLDFIDKYSADALRFTLVAMAAQGRDVKLAESRVEGYRNFTTKLWNAARFTEMNSCVRVAGFDPRSARATVNRWIAGETEKAVTAVAAAIEDYRFNDAANAAYQFIWGTYCDWYLELTKPILAGTDDAAKAETRAMTAWVLDQILALAHPFMPYITEELWRVTAETGPARAKLLAVSAWPQLSGLVDAAAEAEIDWVINLISAVRSVRSEMNIPAAAKLDLDLVGANAQAAGWVTAHDEVIRRLARLETVRLAAQAGKGAVQIVLAGATAALPLAGIVDVAAETARLGKELAKTEAEIAKVDAKLGNAQFMVKAPAEVVDEMRERRADFAAAQDKLQAALQRVRDLAQGSV